MPTIMYKKTLSARPLDTDNLNSMGANGWQLLFRQTVSNVNEYVFSQTVQPVFDVVMLYVFPDGKVMVFDEASPNGITNSFSLFKNLQYYGRSGYMTKTSSYDPEHGVTVYVLEKLI